MNRQAVGYIRRSSGKESPLSLTAQTDAITAAARARGEGIARIYRDHGKSGGADWFDFRDKRPEFAAMVDAILAGGVGTVYSYDADRLSRNAGVLEMLLDAAQRSGTAIIDRTGRDLAHQHNRLTAGVLSNVDAQVLRDITERNRANRDEKVRRGDDLGEAPYGWSKVKLSEPGVNSRGEPAEAGACVNVCTDPDAILTVLNAYAAAGSALGAAHLLNAISHPTKRRREWNNRAVQELVEREAPELLPARLGRKHPRHYRVRVLSGLLRCRCGQILSPNGSGWTCRRGFTGGHPRPYNVEDGIVLPWVRAEAERLRIPDDFAEVDTSPGSDERANIEERRRKVLDLYLDGTIEKVLLDEKMRELDAAVARLDALAGSQVVPLRVDWDWSPPRLNEWLRALLAYVDLGDDMRPVRAEWLVPEWRAE